MSRDEKKAKSSKKPITRPRTTANPEKDLRGRAQAILAENSPTGGRDLPITDDMTQEAAIHELQVHKMALEMQNDELTKSSHLLAITNREWMDLFQNLPTPLLTMNSVGRILRVNQACLALLDTKRSAIEGSLFSIWVEPSSLSNFYDQFRTLHALGKTDGWEQHIHGHDKQVKVVQISASRTASHPSGKVDYCLGLTDITKLRAAEFKKLRLAQKLYDQSEVSAVTQRLLRLTEQEKNEALTKLTQILSQVKIGVWEFDFETKTLIFDDIMYELYAATREEFPDPTELYKAYMHPEDLAQIEQFLAKTDPSIKMPPVFRIRRPNGEIRFLQWKYTPMAPANSILNKMSGILFDVTDNMLTTLRLTQTQAAIDSLALVSATDPQGKITYVNDLACQVSGYTRAELLGQDHRILNSGYHEKSFFRNLWHTIQSGKTWKGEICNKRKDGSSYWVITSISPFKNPQGVIESFWSVRFETTELKTSLAELSLSATKLQVAQRLGKTGSFSINALNGMDEMSDEMSDEAKAIYGFGPEDPCDTAARFSRFYPEDLERWKSAIEHAKMNNGVAEGEFRLLMPDQKLVHIFIRRLNTYSSNGTLVSTIGVVQDITERINGQQSKLEHDSILREKQQAIELARISDLANQAKSDFLSTMSHEIRTPLGVMLGYADLLATDSDKSINLHEVADKMRTNGQHLLGLINDVLDLSKIEAGQFHINVDAITTFDFLSNIISTFSDQAASKHISFSLDVASSLPQTFYADQKSLRQILMNVIGNAMKFTEHGRVTVKVACEACATESHSLAIQAPNQAPNQATNKMTFTITDTGCGIPKEGLDHVFQPFMQGDRSISRKFGGTGLGLNLAQNLARKMGGDVTLIKTEVGLGSQFAVSIQVNLTNLSTPKTASTQAPPWLSQSDAMAAIMGTLGKVGGPQGRALPEAKRLDGLRILVCDDFEDNRTLIRIMLDRLGAVVTVCDGAKQCLEETRRQSFDLIFMDIQMPVINGYEAATSLRAQGFKGPIVALTANALMGERERCLAAGCTEYMSKPFNQMRLAQMIVDLVPPALTPQKISASDQRRAAKIYSSLPANHPGQGLVPIFAAKMPAYVEQLKRHVNEMKWTELASLAHQLKGTAGSYGFLDASEICTELEVLAKETKPDLTRMNKLTHDLASVGERMIQS